ncbi:hypothetical protein L9F63_002228, partial [Diploptera punctata]
IIILIKNFIYIRMLVSPDRILREPLCAKRQFIKFVSPTQILQRVHNKNSGMHVWISSCLYVFLTLIEHY